MIGLSRWCIAHRRSVVAAWILVAVHAAETDALAAQLSGDETAAPAPTPTRA
jgi:hypothetical protein